VRKIGEQLDELGLKVNVEDGHRIVEAHVQVTFAPEDDGYLFETQASAYEEPVGTVWLPDPVVRQVVTVCKGTAQLTEEQRTRLSAWLSANGIDPTSVSSFGDITIETRMHGDDKGRSFIGFTQYVPDGDSSRVYDWRQKGALTVERLVEQTAELEPDPTWQGWDAWRSEMQALREANT